MSDDRPIPAFWAALSAAEARLKARWALTRVEYVTALSPPWQVSVWLGTGSDRERDHLARQRNLAGDVAAVMAECGLHDAGGAVHGVVVQSEETVLRDYEGSWFLRDAVRVAVPCASRSSRP